MLSTRFGEIAKRYSRFHAVPSTPTKSIAHGSVSTTGLHRWKRLGALRVTPYLLYCRCCVVHSAGPGCSCRNLLCYSRHVGTGVMGFVISKVVANGSGRITHVTVSRTVSVSSSDLPPTPALAAAPHLCPAAAEHHLNEAPASSYTFWRERDRS